MSNRVNDDQTNHLFQLNIYIYFIVWPVRVHFISTAILLLTNIMSGIFYLFKVDSIVQPNAQLRDLSLGENQQL